MLIKLKTALLTGVTARFIKRLCTLPFEIEDRKIVRIGVNFDGKTRNIEKVLVG